MPYKDGTAVGESLWAAVSVSVGVRSEGYANTPCSPANILDTKGEDCGDNQKTRYDKNRSEDF